MQDLFEKIFVCPFCKKPLIKNNESEIICKEHGIVGRVKLGVFDFLSEQEYLIAAMDGKFDLKADEKKAIEIEAQFPTLDFRKAQKLLDDEFITSVPANFIRSLALKRYSIKYAKMEEDIGLEAGLSIMNKVNPYLAEQGLKPIGGDIALEAGGGHGLHLPSFAKYFKTVVFLDCSFVNLIMGKKLAQETGVEDRIVLVRGDATLLPFKDSILDFVHEAGIIEHVGNPQGLVTEALRVLSDQGTYVCLSPNKYPLTPEPHFKVPLFGIFPRSLRKYIIPITRGVDSEAGTDLLSLTQLREKFRVAGESDVDVYFLPRTLPDITRKTFLRRFIHSTFRLPVVGELTSFILNKVLLYIMPYHIAVVSRQKYNLGKAQN